MSRERKPACVVIAEDDDDDYLLLRDAFEKAGVTNEVHWVQNGEELLEFLRKRRASSGAATPLLVLLDLNMPKMDGRQALREIQGDAALRAIPVIVMTTSQAEEDIRKIYELGSRSYIRKPTSFHDLTRAVLAIKGYWLDLAE